MNAIAMERLGDALYGACRSKDLLDEGTLESMMSISLARGTHPTHILESMMCVAVQNDNASVVAFCLGRGAIVSERDMSAVAMCLSFESHKVMIQAKAVDITYCTDYCGTMLSNAVTSNHLAWARFCLEEGAHPNLSYVDGYKLVIAAAAEKGFKDMVELLLQFGTHLLGSGAIVLAAAAGQNHMIQLLMEKGADANEYGVEDYEDELHEYVGTPLHQAIRNRHVETAKFLLLAGVNPTLPDVRGRTPEMLAKQYDQTEIIIALQGKGSNAA